MGDSDRGSSARARSRLSDELRRLRLHAGLSTTDLATRLSWSQSKVSRIERAAQAIAIPDVRVWAATLGASAGMIDDLVALAERALTEARDWRLELAGGLAAKQAVVGELENVVQRIRSFTADVIPGLLQTLDYARHLFAFTHPAGGSDVAAAAAARIARQHILYGQDRRFEFVIAEQALWWRPGPWPMLAAQVAHIAAVATLGHVEVGVIPLDAEAVAFYDSFEILDDNLVTMELPTRELHLRDPDEISFYAARFARLKSAAVTGDDAAGLLARLQRRLLAET
ncbi:MAG: helix-turn-helix domain-containing protein [Egibacteraceae bacterium]